MNRKLLVAAVSAAVAAPAVGYADGHVSWYARVNNALDINDVSSAPGASSTTHHSSVTSRFGVRASNEIGNGLTAHGRYEFSVKSDREEASAGRGGVEDVRIATVGLSGAFGRVDLGQQWSAYFNTFGTLVSPTFSLGYYLYSSVGGGPFRASNTIKYSNTFGALYAELDIRLNDDASPEGSDVAEKLRGDGFGLGLSFAVNDNITIAAVVDSEDGLDNADRVHRTHTITFPSVDTLDPASANYDGQATIKYDATDGRSPATDRVGIGMKATLGGYWLSLGWQNHQTDDLDAVTVAAIDTGTAGSVDEGDRPEVTAPAKEGADIDTILLYGGGNFSEKTNWLLGYSTANRNLTGVNDATQYTWGVYHNLGGGLRLYYEATSVDDEHTHKDGIRHLMGMRVDF